MYGKDFLGRGWAFPIGTNKASGRILTAEYEDSITQCIKLILSTKKGERIMRPDFGSMLYSYAFESLSLSVLSLMADEVKNSLVLFEPRIKDIEVKVFQNPDNPSRADISISYTVRNTNNPYNMVYPFYLKESS